MQYVGKEKEKENVKRVQAKVRQVNIKEEQ